MMTKKRFIFAHDDVALNLKTPIMDDNKRMNIGEVLDEMNTLYEENEQLKQEKEILYQDIDFLKIFIEKQGFKVKLEGDLND